MTSVLAFEELTIRQGALTFTARAAGPLSGPLVLLLHGFPDGPETWDSQMMALVRAGYRAVAPTLRGYEPSSQPKDGDYGLPTLAADVLAWLDTLGADKAHIIGHDWGATIAYAAVAASPARFNSLVAVAVPQPARFAQHFARFPDQARLSRYIVHFQIPVLSDWWVRRREFAYLRGLWRAWSPGWQMPDWLFDQVTARFAQTGVLTAALTYYRQALRPRAGSAEQVQRLMAPPVAVPTLAIGGRADGCILPDLFRVSHDPGDFPAGLRLVQWPGCGHFPHLECRQEFNGLLLAWLAEHSSTKVSPSLI